MDLNSEYVIEWSPPMKISPRAFSIFLFVSSGLSLLIFTSETSYFISLNDSLISMFLNSLRIMSGAFSHPLFLFRLPEDDGIFVIIIRIWRPIKAVAPLHRPLLLYTSLFPLLFPMIQPLLFLHQIKSHPIQELLLCKLHNQVHSCIDSTISRGVLRFPRRS